MASQTYKTVPFGLHVTMDMYNCPVSVLNDKELVTTILHTLPKQLGMKILTEPVVTYAQPNGKKDPGGWSGFVMIQESHISIHTFIKRRFVTMDIYSCKQFDAQKSIDHFKRVFKTDDVECEIVVRGKKYPAQDIA
jgi:S-adenosylmethionine decarboxylase